MRQRKHYELVTQWQRQCAGLQQQSAWSDMNIPSKSGYEPVVHHIGWHMSYVQGNLPAAVPEQVMWYQKQLLFRMVDWPNCSAPECMCRSRGAARCSTCWHSVQPPALQRQRSPPGQPRHGASCAAPAASPPGRKCQSCTRAINSSGSVSQFASPHVMSQGNIVSGSVCLYQQATVAAIRPQQPAVFRVAL